MEKFKPAHDKSKHLTLCPTKTSISLGICFVCSESLHTEWVDTDLGPYPVMTDLEVLDALSLGANSNSWFCQAHGQVLCYYGYRTVLLPLLLDMSSIPWPTYPSKTDTVDGIFKIKLAKIFGECKFVVCTIRNLFFKFELRLYIQQYTLLPHQTMDESFQDYSWIQDFEADFS